MTKKTLLFGLAAGLLAACSNQMQTPLASSPGASNTSASQMVAQLKSQGNENVTVIDVGNGKKTPAAFSMTVHLNNFDEFKTKASSSGIPAGSTMNKLRVFLLESTSAPAPGDVTALVKNTGGTLINRSGTGTHTFIFSNVPPNAASNKYFVGVSALLDVPSGPPTAPYTLNLVATPNTHFFGTASNLVVVSSGGGEGAGQVFVDSNYQVSNTTSLTLSMTLKNETGAIIDSSATVNNGSTGLPGITAS